MLLAHQIEVAARDQSMTNKIQTRNIDEHEINYTPARRDIDELTLESIKSTSLDENHSGSCCYPIIATGATSRSEQRCSSYFLLSYVALSFAKCQLSIGRKKRKSHDCSQMTMGKCVVTCLWRIHIWLSHLDFHGRVIIQDVTASEVI